MTVGEGITDDISKENFKNIPSFFVHQTSRTTDDGLGDGYHLVRFYDKTLGNSKKLLLKYVSYQCFPVCPPRETLLRKQNINLLARKQKCFLTNSEKILLRKQCFLVCPHVFKCFQHEKRCFPDWACSILKIRPN